MKDDVRRCQKLQRLLITETRATWIGALTVLQHLHSLTDFDFDRIFQVKQIHTLIYSITNNVSATRVSCIFRGNVHLQVFEHLDPKSVINSDNHPLLKLRSLYSTAPCVRGDSIDAAANLCPNIEVI